MLSNGFTRPFSEARLAEFNICVCIRSPLFGPTKAQHYRINVTQFLFCNLEMFRRGKLLLFYIFSSLYFKHYFKASRIKKLNSTSNWQPFTVSHANLILCVLNRSSGFKESILKNRSKNESKQCKTNDWFVREHRNIFDVVENCSITKTHFTF